MYESLRLNIAPRSRVLHAAPVVMCKNRKWGDLESTINSSKNPPLRNCKKGDLGTKVCTKQTFVPERFCVIIETQKNRESIENTGFFSGAVAKW